MVGLKNSVLRANLVLRFFDVFEGSSSEECEDGGTQAGHTLRGNQHRTAEDVGIHAIQDLILLRNPSGVDHPLHLNSAAFHAFEDYAGVKRGALDRCE